MIAFFLLAGTLLYAPLYAQNSQFEVQSNISWDKQQVDAEISLNLASVGISFPSGRARAEEMIDSEFPRLMQEPLSSILIDSSSTMMDIINRNEYSIHDLSTIALSAAKIPPALALDMQSMFSRFTINLQNIRSSLVKHRTMAEIPKTLNPTPSRSYTGIIIFANTELTIHGRQSKALPLPCMFPKIWDSEMNLMYERNMVKPETARNQGIVQYVDEEAVFRETASGMDEELIKIAGENPLRIIAQGVFGAYPTDPIINRDDALIIISNEENRKLLQDGRVIIVLDGSVIHRSL
jgi:hypothetical protein